MTDAEKIENAIALAVEDGGHDGAHHKMWVIDQMVRILAGDRYETIVADAMSGEDGPNTYSWDVGHRALRRGILTMDKNTEIGGIKVIANPHLPPNMMIMAPDLFDLLSDPVRWAKAREGGFAAVAALVSKSRDD